MRYSAAREPAADRLRPLPYWQATQQPVACLALLAPLIVVYEVAVAPMPADAGPVSQLVAHNFVQRFTAWLGGDAYWMPGMAAVATLIVWQLLAPGPWRLRAWVPGLMVLESVALAVPLLVLGRLLQAETHPMTAGLWHARIVTAVGAGVYEELVFRFYLVGGLILVCRHGLVIGRRASQIAAVLAGALLFSLCHFTPVGSEAFSWPLFCLFAAAGSYLGLVFVMRGVGISTGTHVAYNLLSLLAL